jgi:hypothetical protein
MLSDYDKHKTRRNAVMVPNVTVVIHIIIYKTTQRFASGLCHL